jgi:two-component system, chemotaxis family, response regulator Rcp1
MQQECVEILLVEDNPGDVTLTRLALREGHIVNHLHVAVDGEDALNFLYRRGIHQNAVRPNLVLLDLNLVLLDLNLPKKNGREVLEIIKNDDDLKDIPVCILTGSKAEEDIVKSYKLHANCYIVKPVDFQQFLEVVKSLEDFWFKIVRIPTRKYFEDVDTPVHPHSNMMYP